MRRLAIASLLILGCFDWDVLSSTLGDPDLSVSDDLAMADLKEPDLALSDLRTPDLLPPPDLSLPVISFTRQDVTALGGKKPNNALFGWNATNLTAVGDGGVVAKTIDGKTWTLVTLGVATTQNLNDVWFFDVSNGWIVGSGPTAYQWNGLAWTANSAALTNDVFGVFGSATNKVVAAGSADAIFRSDGTNWTKSNNIAPKPATQNGVWGIGGTFFSVGASDDCINITDTAISKLSCSQAGGAVLRSVWGFSASNILTVGYDNNTSIASKSNGTGWSKVNNIPNIGKLYAVWGASATDIWVGGDGGQIMRHDGTNWTRVTVMGIPNTEVIKDIWGADANNIWLLTDVGSIYKKN